MITVELIDTAGGDLSVVNSARVSFDKTSEYETELLERDGAGFEVVERLAESDYKLIRYLAKHRHDTPFRHNFIQLRCSVPLFLARQLMKHQAGLTWNEVSRRYVDTPPEFYKPVEWRSRPHKSIKQGSGDTHPSSHIWEEEVERFTKRATDLYNTMVEDGVAPEMARMVLPQSMMVDFIWSGNLLAFSHVYALRSGAGAQEEARLFAILLKEAIEPHFPVAWSALLER